MQVARALPSVAASLSSCGPFTNNNNISRCLTTTQQAPQHAQAEPGRLLHQHEQHDLFQSTLAAQQQQHQKQQQEQQQAAATSNSSTPPLLACDEVYVSCDNLRPTQTPGAHILQQQRPITAVFLHGLLGSSRNWRSFSRKLAVEAAAKANRDVHVLLLDLRCHGDSAGRLGFHPPHDMAAAARDVTAIIQHELQGQAPHLLVGLSLGGKIALEVLKQMVEAQEEAQHRQQHLYQHAPPILPPGEQPSSSSSTSGEPQLQGVPQQVGGWVLTVTTGAAEHMALSL